MDDLRFHRAKVDEDLTITIGLAPDKPFPSWWHSGSAVTLTDVPTGDVYIGEIIDLHDCYRDGGEASYVWVQLR